MANKLIAFYVDNPEVLDIIRYFNASVVKLDYITKLHKKYVIIDEDFGYDVVDSFKDIRTKYVPDSTSGYLIQCYILTEK